MKKIIFAIITSFVVISAACDKDHEMYVDQQTRALFAQLYPLATNVEWKTKSNYSVAEFNLAGKEASAWFIEDRTNSAVWQMTEYDMSYNELPIAVRQAFEAGQYATWHVDDIDCIARPDMDTIYIIDVEQGAVDMYLQYSSNGVLVKETADIDDEHITILPPTTAISSNISDYIATNYPDAKIIDEDIEHGNAEIEIVSKNKKLTLLFTITGEWQSTVREDLLRSDVPEQVMNAVMTSQYGTYRIDDIEYWQTVTSNYYRFELESGNTEIYMKVLDSGKII